MRQQTTKRQNRNGLSTTCHPSVYLLDSSLLFGGPSLLALMQLLHISLQVDHLLLKHTEIKKKIKSSSTQLVKLSSNSSWSEVTLHDDMMTTVCRSGYLEMTHIKYL